MPANTSSYAMFSVMDFLPTLAAIVGGRMPDDRPIDGVDQTDILFGNTTTGKRDTLFELHRTAAGRRAMEATAHLFHRHGADRHRAAASATA